MGSARANLWWPHHFKGSGTGSPFSGNSRDGLRGPSPTHDLVVSQTRVIATLVELLPLGVDDNAAVPPGPSPGRPSCSRQDKTDRDWTAAQVVATPDVWERTVFRTKRRYAEEGLDEVLRLHNQVNRRTGSWTTGGEAQLIAPSLS